MTYKCIKSISVGEQDTSHFRVEVFTIGVEYPCIDGYLTDNVGVKRSIDKPKFKEHFEAIGDSLVDELTGEIKQAYIEANKAEERIKNGGSIPLALMFMFKTGCEYEQNKSNPLIEVVQSLTATLSRYEAGFKRIEQLANVPMHIGTSEMYVATRSIISVCDELKRMPKKAEAE